MKIFEWRKTVKLILQSQSQNIAKHLNESLAKFSALRDGCSNALNISLNTSQRIQSSNYVIGHVICLSNQWEAITTSALAPTKHIISECSNAQNIDMNNEIVS